MRKLVVLLFILIISQGSCLAENASISLNSGESCEFINNGYGQGMVLSGNPYASNASYDYSIFNNDGTVVELGMLKKSQPQFKIPSKGKVIITVVKASKLLDFWAEQGDFICSKSLTLALIRVNLKSGQECEFTNISSSDGSMEVYAQDSDSMEFNYAAYDKAGNEISSSSLVNYNTRLAIPAGGYLAVKLSAASSPVNFGGCSNSIAITEGNQITKLNFFSYKNLDAAKSPEEAMKILNDVLNKLTDSQKADDGIKDEAAKFAEFAVEKASCREFSAIDNKVELNYKTIGEQIEQAESAKVKAERIMTSIGLQSNREIEKNIMIKAREGLHNVSVTLNQDLIGKVEGVNSLEFDTGYVTAAISCQNLQDEIGSSGSLTIKVNCESKVTKKRKLCLGSKEGTYQHASDLGDEEVELQPVYNVEFEQGSQPLSKLNRNISLAFPAAKGDPEYNCVFVVEGEDDSLQPLGGKYSMVTGRIEIETNKAGRYYVSENKKGFEDVNTKDALIRKAVEVMASKGVIDGKEAHKFEPDSEISRAEFVKLIVRTLYFLDEDVQAGFDDVPSNAWYYHYVASSKKEGLVNGYPDNTFRAKNIINKQEIVKVCAASLQGKKKFRYPCLLGLDLM